MENTLDYYDIQANILVNYAEFGYIKARYLFFKVNIGEEGRDFIRGLLDNNYITTVADPQNGITLPEVTTNIGVSYNGLKKLGLPVLTLQSFPDEYIIGMRGRRAILGDDGKSDPHHWDEVYKEEIHLFISMEARDMAGIEKRYNQILDLIKGKKGVELLDGHKCQEKGKTLPYQDASALYNDKGFPTAKEHFGYSDGISNPFFKGMTEDMGDLLGGGKKSGIKQNGYGNPELAPTWEPLETGEFILGYKDEAQEYPPAPTPPLLSKNGSFMVFSKFHENVGKFNHYLDTEGVKFPGGKEALAAKFVGRWRNGAPLTTFPTEAAANAIAAQREAAVYAMAIAQTPEEKLVARQRFKEVNKKFTAFDYNDDIQGSRCPVGAHTRRANPRGSLEFGQKGAFDTPSALDNRRRLIRRGLPYGIANNPNSNDGEHGTIIMTITASIKRQFEFVFQQWMNYGNDFKLANDKDTIVGNHTGDKGRMVIQGDESTAPHFLGNIPRFIDTRGGEYLFLPSLTALNMISIGIVDPT